MKKEMTLLLGICFFIFGGGQAYAQKVKFDYVTHIGGAGASTHAGSVYKPRTLAVDEHGNIYNAGKVSVGEVEFDVKSGGKKLKADDGGHYIAKYDSAQNLLWVKQYGNLISSSETQSVVVDASGNIYLAGYFMGYFDVDPGPAATWAIAKGSTDMFIIKLDPDGNYLWHKAVGDESSEFIYGMTIDKEGNIYTTGFVSNNDIDISPGSPNSVVPRQSCFVWKLNPSGGSEWVKSWKGLGREIALDSEGNIFVVGQLSNRNVDFNPGTGPADTFFLSTAGNIDVFVSKLDPAGNFLWARSFGGPEQEQGFSLAVDEAGAVYTTGIFAGTADFNPWGSSYRMTSMNPYNNPSDMEVFVSKINADGSFAWARQINGPGSNWGHSIAAGKGKAAGVYVTGVFRESSADFYEGNDTITLYNPNGSSGSAFLFKLDTSGTFKWSYATGGTSSGAVAVDDGGNVYTAGWFLNGTTDFDPDPNQTYIVNRKGSTDGYIHKMKWCQLTDTVSETACKGYVFKGVTYNATGMYEVPNPDGCDAESKTILNLTIYKLEPIITIDEKILSTSQPYVTYQWMKDGYLLNGATNRSYTVTENGDYRVIVTNEMGCVDTSDVYRVTNADVGINDIARARLIEIYPNPAQDVIYANAPFDIDIQIYSVEGRMVQEVKNAREVKISQLSEGLYFIRVFDEKGVMLKNEKIVKRN